MSEHNYRFLTARERLTMVRPRLADAERQLYEATLNSKIQPGYDSNILNEIQSRITWLTDEYDRLATEISAEEAEAPTPTPSLSRSSKS